MNGYNFWKLAYAQKWASKEDLQLAVYFDDLEPEQYKEITGEPYPGNES